MNFSEFLSQISKNVIDILSCLGTDLQMLYSFGSAILKDIGIVEFAISLIGLVSDDGNNYIGLCEFLDLNNCDLYLSRPELLNVSEGLFAGEIIGHDDTMGSFVVCACNGSESFLASSIPNLQFDFVVIDGERSEWSGTYLNLKSTPMVAK